MTILSTQNLKKIYGSGENQVHALDGVNFQVERGEFVAVVGTSGSGKSTLLHMLGGLDRPTSGTVTVDGRDIFSLKDEELTIFRRRKIGFVFQNYNLVPVLNVYENILLPVQLDGGSPDQSYIKKIIDTLGIASKLENLPNNLSGGQQQRVAIARALASKPAIILADEPTGSVIKVKHYPKIIPVMLLSLSILISSITDRQRVRFSSRVKVPYMVLKSEVRSFLTDSKFGGFSCIVSGSCCKAAVYIS